jgi:hypothetical protein
MAVINTSRESNGRTQVKFSILNRELANGTLNSVRETQTPYLVTRSEEYDKIYGVVFAALPKIEPTLSKPRDF